MHDTVITIPIKGTKIKTILDAQSAIDRIFAAENYHTGSLLHGDENILENINHINLDDTSTLVESLEVRGARIFPNKQSVEVQNKILTETILETQFVQEGKDFYKVSVSISKKVLTIVLQLLIRFDRLCERAIYTFDNKPVEEKKVIDTNVIAFGPVENKKVNSYFSKRKTISRIPVVYIPSQKDLAMHVFNIKTSKAKLVVEPKKNTTNYKSGNLFFTVISLIYTEIRYGGRLKDIDSN